MDPDPGLGPWKTLNAKKPPSWKTQKTPPYRKKIVRLINTESLLKKLVSKPSEKIFIKTENALNNKNKFKCKISKIV